MMGIRPSTYFLIFLILIGVVFAVYSLTFPVLQSRIAGVIIAVPFVTLGVIQLLRETRFNKNTVQGEEKSLRESETNIFLRRAVLLSTWVGGFIVSTYLFGFLVSIPLFVIIYLKCNNTKWIVAILVAAINTAVVIGIFESFLSRVLWRGILPFF